VHQRTPAAYSPGPEGTLNDRVDCQFSIKRSARHPRASTITTSVKVPLGGASTGLGSHAPEPVRAEDTRNLVFLLDTVMRRLLALAEEDPFCRLVSLHGEEEAEEAAGILSGAPG
jgi:hypothetical protein